MTQDAILEKILQAYGGVEKLSACQEIEAEFDFSFFQPDGTEMSGHGRESFKKPCLSYFEFNFPGKSLVNASNGKTAWQTEDGDEKKEIDVDRFVLNARLRNFPLLLKEPELVWHYKGVVDLDHFDQVHWIQIIYSEKEKVSLYLDPLSYWLRRYQGPSKVMGRNVTTVVEMDDYQKVEKIPFPQKLTFLFNVNKFQERVYTALTVNPGLDAALFQK